MIRLLPAAATALCMALTPGLAGAATITMQSFSPANYATAVTPPPGGSVVVEDFENLNLPRRIFEDGAGLRAGATGQRYGEIADVLRTGTVGSFTTIDGTGNGSGSTCRSLSLGNNTCDNIALQFNPRGNLNGQGNVIPGPGGLFAINSNDTLGITWEARLGGGQTFNRIVFALRDAAEFTTLTIASRNASEVFSGFGNNQRRLFVIDLAQNVRRATITLEHGRLNDGFTLDGAALVSSGAMSPVPLPAGAWLILGGLGALLVARRQRKTPV